MLAKIKAKLRKLPHSPGIYIFKDAKNRPLYIGKSSDLQNRVKYYFRTNDFRLQKMIATAKKVDYIQTDSDIEALIIESQYIKKHKPPFNIMLRDDKQYGFVGFTEERYPKIFITHQPTKMQNLKIKIQNDSSKFKNNEKAKKHATYYIGPFTDVGALKTTLNYLRRIFPYCTCKQLHNNYCLNYHIGKCLGICCLKNPVSSIKPEKPSGPRAFTGYQVLREYNKNIKAIKNLLSGKRILVIKNIDKEMKETARRGDFQKAIELRDKIKSIKRVFENAKIISNARVLPSTNNFLWKVICREAVSSLKLPRPPSRIEGYDVANIQGKYAVGAMVVFILRQSSGQANWEPNKSEYRKFKIHTKESPDDTAMLKEILTRRFNHSGWPMPDLILVDGGKAQLNIAATTIYRGSTSIDCGVVALTKNEKHKGEKIYVAGKAKSIPLSQLSVSVKNLLLRINSEAHRFAISYYRKLHRKNIKQTKTA